VRELTGVSFMTSKLHDTSKQSNDNEMGNPFISKRSGHSSSVQKRIQSRKESVLTVLRLSYKPGIDGMVFSTRS